MGVSANDFDGDGDLDLFMTHLTGETNTFFFNDGRGLFEDRTLHTGLGPPSWATTGWGIAAVDYDSDGLLDLAIANGAVRTIQELADQGDPFPFRQPNQLFRNLGEGRWIDVSRQAGSAFGLAEVSRALADGDLDGDGDRDLLLVNIGAPARLLLNRVGQSRGWLGARLGGLGGRDMIGGRLELLHAGARTWRRVATDGSFATSADPRVLFGLAGSSAPLSLRAHWPDGSVTEIRHPPTNRYLNLQRGELETRP